jgi:hypothetical protein
MLPINVVLASRNSIVTQICKAVEQAGFKAVSTADSVSVYDDNNEVATVDTAFRIHTKAGHLPVRSRIKTFLSND